MLVYERHAERFGPNAIKVPAISTLITSFDEPELPSRVLIDGSGKTAEKRDISTLLYGNPDYHSMIRFIKSGDEHFNLISLADQIAYILFRKYRELNETETGPLHDKRVDFEPTFSIPDYRPRKPRVRRRPTRIPRPR